MVLYGLYLYIIICYMKEILMQCISTVGERVEFHIISCNIETLESNGMLNSLLPHYRINFYLSRYEVEIGLYVNFEMWWNVKFQAK